jgi:glycosyltransferase involved in cell wall biosynthesis
MSKYKLEIYRPGKNYKVRAYPESAQVARHFHVKKVKQLSGKADLVYIDSLLTAIQNYKKPYAVLIGGNWWWELRANPDKLQRVINVFRKAKVLICLSRFLAEFVETRVNANNTVALPGGLWGTEHVRFKVNPKRFVAKTDYNIEHRPLVVMGINLVGDIKYNGIPIFLEAVKGILKKHNARIVCSGRMVGKQKLANKWKKDYGLEFVNWHRQPSFVDGIGDKNWPQLLTSADVFVHPSMWDSWGCVVADAMYSAVPSMVFTGHGSEEVGNTTVKLSPDDPSHMADSLDRLLSSVSERKLLGASHRDEAIVKTMVHRHDFANILLKAVQK